GDVKFLHRVDRQHDALAAGRLPGAEQIAQHRGYNLPRQAELVLQPAALPRAGVAPLAEPLPVVVHFLLRFAVNLKGNGFAELEGRAAVESGEPLPIQFEINEHDRTGGLSVNVLAGLAIAGEVINARVFENARVESRRFFGFLVEPQAWTDALHG